MSDFGNKKVMAKNLNFYMNLHNKSRTEICDTLNFKYTTFCDWLNSKTYPRIDKIEMLANYFGIQKSDLIEDKNNPHHSNSYDDLGIELYNKLDTEDKAEIRGTMKQMLKADKYTASQSEPPKHIPFADRRTQPQLAALGHEVEIIDK